MINLFFILLLLNNLKMKCLCSAFAVFFYVAFYPLKVTYGKIFFAEKFGGRKLNRGFFKV